MPTFLAQIAPQRSTQYGALATTLAPHELKLSLLGDGISNVELIDLANQPYLKFEMGAALSDDHVRELGSLAMTSAFFEYRERLGDDAGPWLRPIQTSFRPAFSPDLVSTRRYRGKTNELLTFFMCNVARFSSAFAREPWSSLRVFDPLCGGGTTLFATLVLGADAAGVEKGREDVESTVAFLKQYAREEGIACAVKEERLRNVPAGKKSGRRWWFTLGEEQPQQCVIARGETAQSAELMVGVKRPHLIVTDLPYGIQHRSELTALLEEALPAWAEMLMPGGALAFAWESARCSRAEMISLVESRSGLQVLNDAPYDRMAHRVDRAIKQRDVIVTRKAQA